MKDIDNKAQKEISTAIKNRKWWLENFPLLLKINIVELMAKTGIKSSNIFLVKISSFIQQMFWRYILFARHSSRHLRYGSEQNRKLSLLSKEKTIDNK